MAKLAEGLGQAGTGIETGSQGGVGITEVREPEKHNELISKARQR